MGRFVLVLTTEIDNRREPFNLFQPIFHPLPTWRRLRRWTICLELPSIRAGGLSPDTQYCIRPETDKPVPDERPHLTRGSQGQPGGRTGRLIPGGGWVKEVVQVLDRAQVKPV